MLSFICQTFIIFSGILSCFIRSIRLGAAGPLSLVCVVCLLLPGAVLAQDPGGTVGDDPDFDGWGFYCDYFGSAPGPGETVRNVLAIRDNCAPDGAGFDLVAEFTPSGYLVGYRVANITIGDGEVLPYEDPNTGNSVESVCPDMSMQARGYYYPDKYSLNVGCEFQLNFEIEGPDGKTDYYYLSGQITATWVQRYVLNYSTSGQIVRVRGATESQADPMPALTTRFMRQRADTLLSSQPDLAPLLRGDRRARHRLDYSDGVGSFDLRLGEEGPVWADLNLAWSTREGAELSYAFGALGGHVALGERTILGAMLQLDHARMDDPYADIEGQGWLVGPYMVHRAAAAPVFLEARLLYGRSSNDIHMENIGRQSFETERWLAALKLSGEVRRGATTWTPLVELAYTEDRHDGFVDLVGYEVPVQSVALGELTFGLGVVHALTSVDHLTGGLSWIGSHERTDAGIAALNRDDTSGRGRIELGWEHRPDAGPALSVSGYWDGIGRSGYDVQGVSVRLFQNF
ncbi:Autotransporter beta-domain-containing protein [Mameliella alba]|uniref:autotransporter domain-containing protein n=1 Tax=Mameliella alba TaxID=561184 RepID=UPI000881F31B|nr:autotransporter domain-containing protein [Mameliella alba]OWV44728.1 hypothetical protein CDZ96_21080 [Mameliella alba]PTR36599.1 autotransporter-like protein [Mameliella alba]GGF79106.1 hypothetical protein GCM10011319_44160 [Mameliella alba]SDC78151.1 Autotransporter beta-domain-containing protein [Mameliella alba]